MAKSSASKSSILIFFIVLVLGQWEFYITYKTHKNKEK